MQFQKRWWAYLDTSLDIVNWNVARGILVSSSELTKEDKAVFLSPFTVARIKKKGEFWNFELGLEKIRADKFSDKVSRLNSLFVFHSETEADKAGGLARHFNKILLSELLSIEVRNFFFCLLSRICG